MSDDERSMSDVEESEEETPLTAKDLKDKGNEYFKQASYRTAIEWYTKALDAQPEEADIVPIYSNRAAALLNMNKFADAVSDCDRAIAMDPKFTKAYLRKGRALWKLCDFDAAKASYEEVLKRQAGNADASKDLEGLKRDMEYHKLAKAAYERGDMRMAKVQLNRIFEHCYGSRDIILLKAKCMLTSEPEVASRDLRDVLMTNPQDVEVLTLRGTALLHTGPAGASTASQHFKQALDFDPDYTPAAKAFKAVRKYETFKAAANDLYKARKYEEAEAKYTDVINLHPDNKRLNSVIYNNRAAARKELKKYEEAEQDCTLALQGDERFVKAYVRRSRIREDMEKWDDALRDMEAAAELDDDYDSEVRACKKRAKMAKRKNWYKILNVAKDATEKEIKKAYFAASKEWHPDKHQSGTDEEKDKAEAKFKEIGEAYAILGDSQKRRKYDMGIIDGESDHPAQENPFAGMGGFGGMGGMGGGHPFFSGMGGGGGRQHFNFSF
eukprot:TRINITY_DN22277_c0_g1_i1.p1 TRINITY_DN22277_c0_g1~~TRINITY_DN22277_c0_g1_i1.p1  ORF type:complete len:497 (+),score=241.26 TRINITY_DN22277_c0_g1_i1:54-1544(+)